MIEKGVPLQFSLKLEFRSDLDNRHISDISQQFASNGLLLPESAVVLLRVLGNEWLVIEEPDMDHTVYTIRKENDKLEIYRNLKQEMDDCQYKGSRRWFVYYLKEELEKIAKQTGFVVEKADKRAHIQYRGVYWISFLLRKTD